MSTLVTRSLTTIALLALISALAPAAATAATDLGQFCVTLSGSNDTIRMGIVQSSGPVALHDVTFRWRGPNYQLGGNGTITESISTPGSSDLFLMGTHNTNAFGGNKFCALYGLLTPPSFNGTYQITCTGQGSFTASGNITFVTCPASATAD